MPAAKAPPQGLVLKSQTISSLPCEGFNDTRKADCTWQLIFSKEKTPSTDSLVFGNATFPPRDASSNGFEAPHRHAPAEIYYITAGRGVVRIEGVDHEVETGDAVFIPGNAEHSVQNTDEKEELKMLWSFPVDAFKDVVYTFSEQ